MSQRLRDPYDELGEEATDAYIDALLQRPKSVTISLSIPEPLLARLKTHAQQRGVAYQRLIKALLTDDVDQLDNARR